MEGGKRDRVTDRGGQPELLGTLGSVSPLQHCRGHTRKFGSLGPTGGRGGQRPGPSRGGETCLPELALWPALCTAGAASHILEAGTRQPVSVSPQFRTGFPHKTPQYNLLLLILQMLSHDHLHQHLLSPRHQGRLAFPKTQLLRIPGAPPHPDGPPPTRPRALKQAARRTIKTPGSPVLSIFVLPTQARAHGATERAQPGTGSAHSGLAGAPQRDNGPRPASLPARRQRALLTVHLGGASASPEAASLAASPRRRRPFIHSRVGGCRRAAEARAGREPDRVREREQGPDARGQGTGAARPFSSPG